MSFCVLLSAAASWVTQLSITPSIYNHIQRGQVIYWQLGPSCQSCHCWWMSMRVYEILIRPKLLYSTPEYSTCITFLTHNDPYYSVHHLLPVPLNSLFLTSAWCMNYYYLPKYTHIKKGLAFSISLSPKPAHYNMDATAVYWAGGNIWTVFVSLR